MKNRHSLKSVHWDPIALCSSGATREEWFKVRSEFNGMTGSVAPIFFSAVSYNSLEKEYDKRVNDSPQSAAGWQALKGTILEPYILEQALKVETAERALKFEIVETPAFIRHPLYDWAACSPDFLAVSLDPHVCEQFGTRCANRLLCEPLRICGEIKHRDGTQSYKYRDGATQLSERAQTIWNTCCADADVGLLLVDMLGDVKPYIIKRDLDFELKMFKAARDFLTAVKAGDRSKLLELSDKAEERWSIVRSSYKGLGTEESAEDPELDKAVATLQSQKEARKKAETEIKKQSAIIGNKMRGAEHLITQEYSIKWGTLKNGKRGALRIKGATNV